MKPLRKLFAVCIENTDYKASLIPGKVYQQELPPSES